MKYLFVATVLALGLGSTIPAVASTVTEVQQFLADKNCEPGAVDGQWGGGSRKAADRFREITGITIAKDTDIATLPQQLIAADCTTDIDLGPPDVRPAYTTPTDTLDLPGGIRQYNWIPETLRDFAWTKSALPFVDVMARSSAFTDKQKAMLGCESYRTADAASRVAEMRAIPVSLDTMADGSFLTYSGGILVVAFCTGSTAALQELVGLYAQWAEADAFVGLHLRELARAEYEDPSIIPAKFVGRSKTVPDTLSFRETLNDFLIAWSVAKASLSVPEEQVGPIEGWLHRLVNDQAFSYSDQPLDCPSFDRLRNTEMINNGKVMRWDQFEECINTGTSRAGVMAMWAMISGDRAYAEDALNIYFMTLNMLRSDGSHILESVRENVAHYKSVYNVAWMSVVAEAFASEGIDLYGQEVEGRSIFSHMQFLAKSAVDGGMRKHYVPSNPKGEDRIEMKDPWHWLVLARYGTSKTAQLIKREMAGTSEREDVFNKMFNVFKVRASKGIDRDALLPFTMFFAPEDFFDYAPSDIRAILSDVPGTCPDMGWTQADEVLAGDWSFTWTT
ncbi:MAG: alginate lyase family protein, partial [Devosia sp.]